MLILPGYRALLAHFKTSVIAENATTLFGHGTETFSILYADGPGGIPIYFIAHAGFFDRAGNLRRARQESIPTMSCATFFWRAPPRWSRANYVHPEVIHAHDWHCRRRHDHVARADPNFAKAAATRFPSSPSTISRSREFSNPTDYPLLGIDWSHFNVDGLGILRQCQSDEGRDRAERRREHR